MEIVAKISRNFRDVQTGQPKVLLRIDQVQSETFDRDHTFVPLTAELRAICDTIKNNRTLLIKFDADECTYTDKRKLVAGVSAHKQTLKNIRNVKVVGRV